MSDEIRHHDMADLEALGLPDDYLVTRKEEICAAALRVLPDGRELAVVRMLFNWRMTLGPVNEPFLDDFWCYENFAEALTDCAEWDGQGDPRGEWHRHGASGRRREWKDGEIIREWVQR
jgi:hypothetical protein